VPALVALSDEGIAERMAALGVQWGVSDQTVMIGKDDTDIQAWRELLSEMGAADMELRTPSGNYDFHRDRNEDKANLIVSRSRSETDYDEDSDRTFGAVRPSDEATTPMPSDSELASFPEQTLPAGEQRSAGEQTSPRYSPSTIQAMEERANEASSAPTPTSAKDPTDASDHAKEWCEHVFNSLFKEGVFLQGEPPQERDTRVRKVLDNGTTLDEKKMLAAWPGKGFSLPVEKTYVSHLCLTLLTEGDRPCAPDPNDRRP
jgi:hypothetical protein